jgi:uracil-DNA glycosylase family 4
MTEDWDRKDDPYFCPHCHDEGCVPAGGAKSSPILVIGEFPGEEEIKKGRPLVGRTGNVLKAELAYYGIDMKRLRLGNLWLHPPNKNEDCFNYGVEQILKEAQGREVILLLGSDTVKYFCNEKVSDVTGLQVQSSYLSAPIVFACLQPATVFHQSVGELRLSLKKFVKLIGYLL